MILRVIKYSLRKILTIKYRFIFKNRSLVVGYGTEILCRNVSLGAQVEIDQRVFIGGECPGSLSVGDNSKINSDVKLDTTGSLQIGKNTVVSEYAIIYTHGHGGDPYARPRPYSLVIGDNVWIGARALIMPSVRVIPDGTIVPAGAVIR